jgi:hypothetical protein
MTEYIIKSKGFRDCVLTLDDKTLGQMEYQKWFSFEALISLEDGSVYKAAPKGFWGTTIEILKDEAPLMNFKMGWNGSIVIHSWLDGIEQDYVFKPRGILKSG